MGHVSQTICVTTRRATHRLPIVVGVFALFCFLLFVRRRVQVRYTDGLRGLKH